jgi:hypothetical protein
MSGTTFTLEKLNVSKLEKTHIIPEMAESSFKTSPRLKKTKVKDILEEKKHENTLDDDNCNKIIINHGITKLSFYSTIGSNKIANDEGLKQTYGCYHCHCDIAPNDFFLGIPVKKNKELFECIGIVCSWECAATHINFRNLVNDPKFSNSYYLLANMYFLVFKTLIPKDLANRPLFAYEMIKRYGGDLDTYGKKVLISTNVHISSSNETKQPVKFSIQPKLYQELKK